MLLAEEEVGDCWGLEKMQRVELQSLEEEGAGEGWGRDSPHTSYTDPGAGVWVVGEAGVQKFLENLE